uniref:Uncharacterized protein n=1 Tax=viral metagenome TaxID=1070528 RepID=A0A6C0LV83_9ZZZZ
MKLTCDIITSGVIFIGSISTVTFSTLQYLDYVNDWRLIVISSGVTIAGVFGNVMYKTSNSLRDIIQLDDSSDT